MQKFGGTQVLKGCKLHLSSPNLQEGKGPVETEGTALQFGHSKEGFCLVGCFQNNLVWPLVYVRYP